MVAAVLVELERHNRHPRAEKGRSPTPLRSSAPANRSVHHADLGRQAAARAAEGLVPGPPFAPLAFGWAVTMVPSTRAYSKSGSSDRHSKTRSKAPPFTQRRNRWKTLFQWPKSLGRSRQGTPVRTRHSTASRNSRLSLAVAPGSEALPGNSGAIFSQTASPTMNRDLSSIAPTPPKRRLKHDPPAGGILNVNRP